MVNILSPSGLEDPLGGEPHSRAMHSRNLGRINENWKPLEGPISVTLTAGWESRGSGYPGVVVYKEGTQIRLRGSITNTNAQGWTLGTEYVIGSISDARFAIAAGKAAQFPGIARNGSMTSFKCLVIVSYSNSVTNVSLYFNEAVASQAAKGMTISFDNIGWPNF